MVLTAGSIFGDYHTLVPKLTRKLTHFSTEVWLSLTYSKLMVDTRIYHLNLTNACGITLSLTIIERSTLSKPMNIHK